MKEKKRPLADAAWLVGAGAIASIGASAAELSAADAAAKHYRARLKALRKEQRERQS